MELYVPCMHGKSVHGCVHEELFFDNTLQKFREYHINNIYF